MNRNTSVAMSIEKILEDLYKEMKDIEEKIHLAKKEYKTYRHALKRAKSDSARQNIQNENIAPVLRKISLLKKHHLKKSMQVKAVESYVLGEELEARQSGALTAIQDDRKLRYIFTRFRRFGNFNGYIAGRKEEADKELKEYFITKKINSYIKETGKAELCDEYEIDPNSRSSMKDLRYAILEAGAIELGDLDGDIRNFISDFINENTVFEKSDRKHMIELLQKNVPRNEPSTPLLDLLNDSIADEERDEEGRDDEEPEGPDDLDDPMI